MFTEEELKIIWRNDWLDQQVLYLIDSVYETQLLKHTFEKDIPGLFGCFILCAWMIRGCWILRMWKNDKKVVKNCMNQQ